MCVDIDTDLVLVMLSTPTIYESWASGAWGVAGELVWLVRCGAADNRSLPSLGTHDHLESSHLTSKHNHGDGDERTAYCAVLPLAK